MGLGAAVPYLESDWWVYPPCGYTAVGFTVSSHWPLIRHGLDLPEKIQPRLTPVRPRGQ